MNPLINPPVGQPTQNPLMQSAPMQSQPQMTPQQLDDYIFHNKNMSGMLSTLITDPNVSTKKVLASISDAVKAGSMSAQQAAKEAADMPVEQKDLQAYLKNQFIRNLEIGRQLHALKFGA